MVDETKNTIALLNGICKRSYYGETDLTDEFLHTEIFPDVPDDAFNALLAKCTGLVKVDI